MNTILFVCIGNAYRSQMAEAFFNHHNKDSGYLAISAGTQPMGHIPAATIQLMADKGISLSRHKSKRLTPDMIAHAAKIYILYDDDFSDLPKEKLVMMPIRDPYYESAEQMTVIRDEIEQKVMGILQELRFSS
jgi:arsenate reductase (thioredoxin)